MDASVFLFFASGGNGNCVEWALWSGLGHARWVGPVRPAPDGVERRSECGSPDGRSRDITIETGHVDWWKHALDVFVQVRTARERGRRTVSSAVAGKPD